VIRINVGGMATNEITTLIHKHGDGKFLVQVTSDIAGAREVATGAADYYFGSCTTGGGGALSMAIAILGYTRCFTVSMPGKLSTEERVLQNSGYGWGSALLGPLFEGYGRRWGRRSVTMSASAEISTAGMSVMGPRIGPRR